MAKLAPALPFLKAVGPFISLASSFLGSKSKSPAPPPPAPPPPAPEPTKEPEGTLDTEAARARAIKRRQSSSRSGGLLNLIDGESEVRRPTLLGS